MASATTTLPDATSHLSASATVLVATLTGATVALPSDESIRGLVAKFLSDRAYEIPQPSVALPPTLGHAVAESTTHIAEPDEWQELEALEDDWDASGAKRISPVAIAHARRFLASLAVLGHRFSPFADPTGSVGLQARETDKSAYMLVNTDNRFTYVIRVGDRTHRGTKVDAEEMQKLLALLY
jgi:hypothetical protein